MIRAITVIILSLYSMSSWSSLYPVLSDMQVNYKSNGFTEVFFTQSLVDIGAAGDKVIPFSQYDLHMGIGRVWGSSGHYTFYVEDNFALVKKGETFSEAALRAYYGGHSRITRLGILIDSERGCAGYAAVAPNVGNNWRNATYYPAGLCVYTPPAGEWCKMTTPALVLDHGRISIEEAEGHSASDKLNIQCSVGTTIRLRLMNNEKHVLLSGGARAEIFVDGKTIGSDVSIKRGGTELTISDKLTGVTEPGELSGMAVLVIEPI